MTDKLAASGQSLGPSIDRLGAPVIDPTENVKALSEAANKRQDDLREASDKFAAMQIDHMREMAQLRAEYSDKLAQAEAKRIDAIRAVDVNAVAVASERQSAAATVLANQVSQSADALRTLVSSTAQTIAEQNRQQFTQMSDRLTLVERSQYEGRGKAGISDPMMIEMVSEMKGIRAQLASTTGKTEATKDYTAWIVAAAGVLLGVAGIALSVLR